MDENDPCSSRPDEIVTSDDIFNDIINIAYSEELCCNDHLDNESSVVDQNLFTIKKNDTVNDISIGNKHLPDQGSTDVNCKTNHCHVQKNSVEQTMKESSCSDRTGENLNNEQSINNTIQEHKEEYPGELEEPSIEADRDLSRASSKSSFSDGSISSSLTSSGSGPSLDCSDGWQHEIGSEQQQEKGECRLARPKSYSLASTQSEMDFIVNDKERRFARMSLERDKRPPIYSGYLIKLGGTGFTPKNWRKRWFVLKRDNCLYYYKDAKSNPVGAVILSNYIVTNVALGINKKFAFQLTKGGARTYTFAASSDIERKTWMKVIAEAAKMPDRLSASPEISIHNVSIPALSIKDPDCHGYLWKQGFSHKSWKKRYSILKGGCLYYYQDMSETVALGIFNLHCYTMQETESTSRKYSFIAIPPQPGMRTYYFAAESAHDRERWLKAMANSIDETEEEQ